MVFLSPSDEYFSHQISQPHALVGSSDPSWRERYWLSLQDTVAKDTVLSLGIGQYPNQDTQEAFVVHSKSGEQRNMRMARSLGRRRDEMAVGPLRIEIVEPMKDVRFILSDNPSGVEFDFHWKSDLEPILEGRHFQVSRTRVTYDAIRYVQLGRIEGQLSVDGSTTTLTPDRWWGERDHSWGTRTLPSTQGTPPGIRPEWRMLMFCPIQFEDFGVHFYLYEAEPGRPLHLSAAFSRRAGAPDEEDLIVHIDHDLVWDSSAAAPTLRSGIITLALHSGEKMEFKITAQEGRAHLRGGGYEGWNGWFQGHWKGEDSFEHDTWDLTDRSQIYRYAKAGSDHMIEVEYAGQTGFGIMEYMVLPGYARYQEAIPAKPGSGVNQ